ncbi:MAG: cell envelope integrity protein TolA [Candidatus Pacebacteria bacterium]|nr:cell envelope integrity protein TolA [Candidatus Paceibacterota bacterium]
MNKKIKIFIISTLFPLQLFAANSAGIAPTNFFYFLDIFVEKVSLTFTFDEGKEAEKRLEYANERIAEMGILAEKGRYDKMEKVLDRYSRDTEKAKEYYLSSEVGVFLSFDEDIAVLEKIASSSPEAYREKFKQVRDVISLAGKNSDSKEKEDSKEEKENTAISKTEEVEKMFSVDSEQKKEEERLKLLAEEAVQKAEKERKLAEQKASEEAAKKLAEEKAAAEEAVRIQAAEEAQKQKIAELQKLAEEQKNKEAEAAAIAEAAKVSLFVEEIATSEDGNVTSVEYNIKNTGEKTVNINSLAVEYYGKVKFADPHNSFTLYVSVPDLSLNNLESDVTKERTFEPTSEVGEISKTYEFTYKQGEFEIKPKEDYLVIVSVRNYQIEELMYRINLGLFDAGIFEDVELEDNFPILTQWNNLN